MLKNTSTRALYRIIDANANRLREGLRSTEEYLRFVRENRHLSLELKKLRHAAGAALSCVDGRRLLESRNSGRDVGRATTGAELERETLAAVAQANLKRAQEAARVLEEYTKLVSARASARFKKIRFGLYGFEKKFMLTGI